MMGRLAMLAATLAAFLAGAAHASSPAAWAAHDAAVKRACIVASRLDRARVSAPILFSDAVGKTAVLVTGAVRRERAGRATGRFLCLYDRRSGRAEASEAPDLRISDGPAAGR